MSHDHTIQSELLGFYSMLLGKYSMNGQIWLRIYTCWNFFLKYGFKLTHLYLNSGLLSTSETNFLTCDTSCGVCSFHRKTNSSVWCPSFFCILHCDTDSGYDLCWSSDVCSKFWVEASMEQSGQPCQPGRSLLSWPELLFCLALPLSERSNWWLETTSLTGLVLLYIIEILNILFLAAKKQL